MIEKKQSTGETVRTDKDQASWLQPVPWVDHFLSRYKQLYKLNFTYNGALTVSKITNGEVSRRQPELVQL
jgi:hypothetical protein